MVSNTCSLHRCKRIMVSTGRSWVQYLASVAGQSLDICDYGWIVSHQNLQIYPFQLVKYFKVGRFNRLQFSFNFSGRNLHMLNFTFYSNGEVPKFFVESNQNVNTRTILRNKFYDSYQSQVASKNNINRFCPKYVRT